MLSPTRSHVYMTTDVRNNQVSIRYAATVLLSADMLIQIYTWRSISPKIVQAFYILLKRK